MLTVGKFIGWSLQPGLIKTASPSSQPSELSLSLGPPAGVSWHHLLLKAFVVHARA